jgi:ribonuclease P protein component
VLPAQYRMTRSTDFGMTVRRGMRAAQPDIVVHVVKASDELAEPKVGLVVSKSVGSAVQRHRVSRMLRHVARDVLDELGPGDKVVIRALPSSSRAKSVRLEEELRNALRRVNAPAGVRR